MRCRRAESQPAVLPRKLAIEEIHGRTADEAGDEQVGGAAVDLHGRADLLQLAAAHDRDPVGEHHRLLLVVGDEHRRDAELALQPLDLGAGVDPQRRVEVGERLVHQEDGRIAHHGAADRHALALAAAELRRPAIEQRPEVQHLGRRCRPAAGWSPASSVCWRRPKLMLSRTRHVRVERIVLEHHGDVALGGSSSVTSRPSKTMAPALSCSRPAMQASAVLLPQPDGPAASGTRRRRS